MHLDAFGNPHRYGPPAGWVWPARESFSVADEWAKLVERGLQFPTYHGETSLSNVRGD